MEFVDRRTLSISDLFKPHEYYLRTYSGYDFRYKQDGNQLCRFPELLELLDNNVWIEKGDQWNYFRLTRPEHDKGAPIDQMLVAKVLYEAFSDCPNMAIASDEGRWKVTSEPKYIDERFETYRNRTLFELRDYLGISHTGKGKDSVMMISRYTGSNFHLMPDK
jgi:hypothetical protein